MNSRTVAGWLGVSLVALTLVTGCNNCTGSVCGNQNSGNDVKDQATQPDAIPNQGHTQQPKSTTPSSTLPQPPSKAEYIKSADAICKKWIRQAEKHVTPDTQPSLELFTTLIQLGTNMANEWRAMTPPAGDTGEADTFIEKQYADVASIQRMRDLWAAGDTDRAQIELDQLNDEKTQAERRASARAYGFRVCY
ncbi:hypothetical protein [Streptomyces sp. NPDC002343]